MKRKRTGIVFFPAFDWAISPTHPERQERLLYTQDQLREEGLFDIDGIVEHKPDVVSIEDIHRTHFCFPDVSSVVTDSHRIAAGGAVRLARLFMEKKIDNGFALVRPPGHHAMKSVHGNRGFCSINNEAIMIEYIREQYGPKRFVIVDTDCHHGDGTQDIYWYDPDVLYISLHHDGRTLYPGSGYINECGEGWGYGKTVNIPLPPGTTDEGFLYALDHVVLPLIEDFKPDIIINSAGQDNHFSDPITQMRFTAQGYACLTERLQPDICVLEGGYSIHGALPYVNLGIILALAGEDYSYVYEPTYRSDAFRQDRVTMETIKHTCEEALNVYAGPGDSQGATDGSDSISRKKHIFYDTDMIKETQTDSIRRCPVCPGYRIIESESTRRPLSVGVDIPAAVCSDCAEQARQRIDSFADSGVYSSICVINRHQKQYYYHGG